MRRVLLPKEGWFDKTCLNSIEKASVEFMGSRLMFTVSFFFLLFSWSCLLFPFIPYFTAGLVTRLPPYVVFPHPDGLIRKQPSSKTNRHI